MNPLECLDDYVIMRHDPSNNKKGRDIDILVKDFDKSVRILESLNLKKSIIDEGHYHFDDIKDGVLEVKYDLYDYIDSVIKVHPLYKDYILRFSKNHIPAFTDDLALRHLEYLARPHKKKHYDYVKHHLDKYNQDFKDGYINNYNPIPKYFTAIIWETTNHSSLDILNELDKDRYLDILWIKKLTAINVQQIIDIVYHLDNSPKEHLQSKLAYLRFTCQNCYIVLLKNHNYKAKQYGTGTPFEITSCENIVDTKWRIRKMFNPRENHHVIHMTDTEEETNYIFKRLINTPPSAYEYHNHLPWHKTNYGSYGTINLSDCKTIFKDIVSSPHYKYVSGDKQPYIDYYKLHVGNELQDNHTPSAFDRLLENFNCKAYMFEKKNLIVIDRDNTIGDGLHRASILYFNGYTNVPCFKF